MRRTILLADSNRAWLVKAKDFLEKELYTVTLATNGKDAQLFLSRNNYFAVALGMGLKNHSGTKVARFIRAHKPDLKVIALLDEESDVPLLEELAQYRIDNILPKSDSLRPLKEELENLESGKDATRATLSFENEDIADDNEQFFKVNIEDFYTSQTIFLDIFVCPKKSHYTKIFKSGEKIEPKRMEQYRNDKEIDCFYFKKRDLNKYIKIQNFLLGQLITRIPDRIDVKLRILKNIANQYWEQLVCEGINTITLKQGKSIAKNIAALVNREKHLTEYLSTYKIDQCSLSSQNFLITLLATTIVKKFRWRSDHTLETMALACLLHNIGMTQLPANVVGKNVHEMDAEEWKLYQQHPELGAEMVGNNSLISSTIKQIILQHHEYYDGTGYPKKKRRNEILILANIICLADDFVHTMFRHDCLPHQALEIFRKDNELLQTRYRPNIVRCFCSLFENASQCQKSAA